jgi:hypothetical protein
VSFSNVLSVQSVSKECSVHVEGDECITSKHHLFHPHPHPHPHRLRH